MVKPVLTDVDLWGSESRATAMVRGMAMAYVWGRQDAGEDPRDTGTSSTFGAVYAVAHDVSGGRVGPVQSAHHEWVETGRVMVSLPGGAVAQVAATGPHGRVEAHRVPWVGTALRWWPGIVAERS